MKRFFLFFFASLCVVIPVLKRIYKQPSFDGCVFIK